MESSIMFVIVFWCSNVDASYIFISCPLFVLCPLALSYGVLTNYDPFYDLTLPPFSPCPSMLFLRDWAAVSPGVGLHSLTPQCGAILFVKPLLSF